MQDNYEKYRSYVDFIKDYRTVSNAATGSAVDANANVESKNVTTCTGELPKADFIGINRLLMSDKLTELYGKDMAGEYIRQLNNHEIYKQDETQPLLPYCVSITMYPFLFNGMGEIGGISDAPKNLQSFCGSFINLVFAIAAQFAGAVSTPEFLTYMDYFIRREYGDEYYKHPTKVVDGSNKHRTIDSIICNYFQQVVYSLNQPAAARSFQSVFWNIAYFDKPYFEGIFEDFVFPDGTKPTFVSVMWLQKRFMQWFNQERLRKILTFPVETVNLLNHIDENDNPTFIDEDFANFVAEMWANGHSFFMYTSDSVDSLASCCYSKDTPVIIKDDRGAYMMTFEEIENTKFSHNGYKIFNNGKWSSGKLVKLPKRKMYKVITSNNKEMIVTDNHRNNCLNGMKLTKDLTTNDYIMFNNTVLNTFAEKDMKLTYNQGFAVGAFLGDGSFGSERQLASGETAIYDIGYSISEKKEWIIPIINQANKECGGENECKISNNSEKNLVPVRICSKQLVNFIIKWTNWERGTKCNTKELNMDCLLQSIDFRKGIIDGWYATDGNYNSLKTGASLRGYTTSLKLLNCMEAVCTSLGYITSTNSDNRFEEGHSKVVFNNVEYNKNYPVYCLLKYAPNKQGKSRDDLFKFRDNSYYFKIKSIEEVPYESDYVYCFEMTNKEDDKFTLPNGIHNFNCRLRNELQDNTFSYTLGAGGVSTGSKCVITINFNRLVQNTYKNKEEYFSDENHSRLDKAIREQVDKIHKYLIAYDSNLKDSLKAGLLPVYDAGYISMDKQFLTIGINGLVEGAEFLGISISPNDEYEEYCTACLKPIFEENKKAKTKEYMFNTEYVPAENLGVKNAKWDKKDGYFVPRDCYNSYFYRPDDPTLSIVDKLILHGKKNTKWLDGGSALHMNLEEHLTKEQYKKLMLDAVRTGCQYFTFNIPNTVCRDCGYISKHKFDKCPRCGSENVDWATRVIGYLKLISKFSEKRQEEASRRYYIDGKDY